MSVGKNNIRKQKRRFRKKFGANWEKEYTNWVNSEWSRKHPLIGSLQDILDENRKS